MSIYRENAPPAAPVERCCGQCSAPLGGCLKGVYFNTAAGRREAGTTWEHPEGTPPVLLIGGRWVRESDVTKETP